MENCFTFTTVLALCLQICFCTFTLCGFVSAQTWKPKYCRISKILQFYLDLLKQGIWDLICCYTQIYQMLGFCTALALHKNQMVNFVISFLPLLSWIGWKAMFQSQKSWLWELCVCTLFLFFSSVLVKAGKLESSAGSGSHQALNWHVCLLGAIWALNVLNQTRIIFARLNLLSGLLQQERCLFPSVTILSKVGL